MGAGKERSVGQKLSATDAARPTLRADLRRLWKPALIALAVWSACSLLLGTPCVWVLLFGIPCPFCGLTRAAGALCRLDVMQAFALHPLWPLLPTLLLLFGLQRYRFPRLRIALILFAAAGFAAFAGVYVWRMRTLYPAVYPMVYTPSNLLAFLAHLIFRD